MSENRDLRRNSLLRCEEKEHGELFTALYFGGLILGS